MSNPAYIHDNVIETILDASPTAGELSSSTEDANYPLENLYDAIYAKPFRFTVTTGGYIEVNFGSTQSFDSVAILGHNMETLTGGTVKAGASANPSTTVGSLTYREQDIWVSTGSQSAQYVRVTLPATGSDNTLIGELVIGTRVVLPRPPRWGVKRGREDVGVTLETNAGVTWDYEYFTRILRDMTFRFPDSEYYQFHLFSQNVKRRPFVFLPNPANSDVFYVKKQRGFRPEVIGPGMDYSPEVLADWWDWHLSLTAESMGLALNL